MDVDWAVKWVPLDVPKGKVFRYLADTIGPQDWSIPVLFVEANVLFLAAPCQCQANPRNWYCSRCLMTLARPVAVRTSHADHRTQRADASKVR